jgi:hypothetical protein
LGEGRKAVLEAGVVAHRRLRQEGVSARPANTYHLFLKSSKPINPVWFSLYLDSTRN